METYPFRRASMALLAKLAIACIFFTLFVAAQPLKSPQTSPETSYILWINPDWQVSDCQLSVQWPEGQIPTVSLGSPHCLPSEDGFVLATLESDTELWAATLQEGVLEVILLEEF